MSKAVELLTLLRERQVTLFEPIQHTTTVVDYVFNHSESRGQSSLHHAPRHVQERRLD